MASAASYGYQQGYRQTQAKSPDFNTFLNFSTITPSMQKHIQKVYLTLAACLAAVAAGAYSQSFLPIGGTLSYLGTLGLFMGLMFTSATAQNENLRLNLLLGGSFLQGCSLGPLLWAVARMDSSIIVSAVVCTSAIFLTFSAAALLAKRREYLYLGGLCGSALSMMMGMRLASFLFGTQVLQFQIELYVGLFVFAGYVVFDTQVMIERASTSRPDYISDSLQLLLDFVAIFVRILVLLTKQQDRRDNEDKRNKRR